MEETEKGLLSWIVASTPLPPALAVTALCLVVALLVLLVTSAALSHNKSRLVLLRGSSSSSGAAPTSSKSRPRRKGLTTATATAAAATAMAAAASNLSNGERDIVVHAQSNCNCNLNSSSGGGPSMMEQLVPEIRTHALSYLDYPSLCRLSMTNSSMRRAANDDNAWKSLYSKDFTTEQDSVAPSNGWKSYYASTKAVVDVNAEYYNILRAKNLPEMSRLWWKADYVKCIHPNGLLVSGYDAVMDNWQRVFRRNSLPEVQVSDIRVRVVGDMAWVTLKEYLNAAMEPFVTTNIYEFHNGCWFMVHHHSSEVPAAAAAAGFGAFAY